MNRAALSLSLCIALLGAGCAAVPSDPDARAAYREANDPLEPLNRKVFSFNLFLDRVLIKPVAKGYVRVVPRWGRDALKNFVFNLNEPLVLANNLLQGRLRRAGTTASRFVIDSSFGLGGLIDFAGLHGLRRETGDFGQTLHSWGVPEGPYLVLPVLGPSNPRDGIGLGVDSYINPYRFVVQANSFPTIIAYGPMIVGGIDERSRALDALDAIEKESVDYYASLRSYFRQNRVAILAGDGAPPAPVEENIYEDPGAATSPKGARVP